MSIRKIIKALLPAVLILGVSGAIAGWMFKNKVAPETKQPEESVTKVQFIVTNKQRYRVKLVTSGEVHPRTKSMLIPQVAGEILTISPNFRTGGFFEDEEVLLVLDNRDYVAAETEAKATLAQAEATYKLEQARSAQAIASWKDLGRGGEPSELTSRKPQLAQAKAEAEAAAARLARATRDLDRTKILAPYAGYVREKSVDIGQYVTPGTTLGEIFAIDYVEVRLPLDPQDLQFVELPERYRRGVTIGSKNQPGVVLEDTNLPGVSWEGKIVRAEGEFDARSRKLFVIAQVDDPYALKDAGRPPLKVGQFVKAEITGRELANVFVIPERAVRFGKEVKVIDQENRIQFREVDVVWSDLPNLIVRKGLNDGDRVCLTTLPFAVDGTLVDPEEFISEPREPAVDSDVLKTQEGPERQKAPEETKGATASPDPEATSAGKDKGAL